MQLKTLLTAAILNLGAGGVANAAATPANIAPPAPGQSQVVFFRHSAFGGGALGCTVHEGPVQIARLGSGKYYVQSFAPGTHVFSVESEAKDVLTMETESDETYYVECNIGMGIMVGRPNLSPADKAKFDVQLAKGIKPWVPKAKG